MNSTLQSGLFTYSSHARDEMLADDLTTVDCENDAAPIGPQADRLLRFLVAQGKLTSHYPTERLKAIDLKKAMATRMRVTTAKDRWTVKAA